MNGLLKKPTTYEEWKAKYNRDQVVTLRALVETYGVDARHNGSASSSISARLTTNSAEARAASPTCLVCGHARHDLDAQERTCKVDECHCHMP